MYSLISLTILKISISTWIITCSILAALFALVATTLQFIKQKADDNSTIKFQEQLMGKQDSIAHLQEALTTKSDKIAQAQDQIIQLQSSINKKNEDIQHLQNKTLQTIRGTNDPPIFSLANNLYQIVFALKNSSSDLPVVFNCVIYDYKKLQTCRIRSGNIIDQECVKQALFCNLGNVKLTPNGESSIEPSEPIPIKLGTIYKYVIYTEVNENQYLEQVYINASHTSINTLIRILKLNDKNYQLYKELDKASESLDWEKEFNLPTQFHLGGFF